MTYRGRGLLEIKPSPNPFFQSTSSDIGVNAKEEIEWKVDGKAPPFIVAPYHSDGNFSFLYSRESDVIGSQVPKTVVEEKKVLSKTEFLKKKREMVETTKNFEGTAMIEEEKKSATAEEILTVYKHDPKYEDPRYTTSNSDYGRKKPSVATIVVDRKAISQGFSKGFGIVKPEQTALTTAITRSNVHKALDPLF